MIKHTNWKLKEYRDLLKNCPSEVSCFLFIFFCKLLCIDPRKNNLESTILSCPDETAIVSLRIV